MLTLKESIQLNQELGVKHTPELKSGDPSRIKAVFGSQEKYAQKMIDEFKAAGVDPKNVWAQSFSKDDILYWIQNEPRFGRQAVYLDDIDPTVNPPLPRLSFEELQQLKKQGVKIIAPPTLALLAVDSSGEIVPGQRPAITAKPSQTVVDHAAFLIKPFKLSKRLSLHDEWEGLDMKLGVAAEFPRY